MIRVVGFAFLVTFAVSLLTRGNAPPAVLMLVFVGTLALVSIAVLTGRTPLRCPHCGKRVKIGSTVCHHCGRDATTA